MKLYIYDDKHNKVNDEFDISDYDVYQVEALIKFLDKNRLTSRYNKLIIAKGYKNIHDGDGGYIVEFEY